MLNLNSPLLPSEPVNFLRSVRISRYLTTLLSLVRDDLDRTN